jgi:hypothetical protein
MIQNRLLLMEYAADNDQMKLEAIRGIKKLLMQIDFNSEVVPTESYSKLKELLESLKGSLLTENEIKLINELI